MYFVSNAKGKPEGVSLDPTIIFSERFVRAPDTVPISDGTNSYSASSLKLKNAENIEDTEWLMDMSEKVMKYDGIYVRYLSEDIVEVKLIDLSNQKGTATLFSDNEAMETTLLRILSDFLMELMRDEGKIILTKNDSYSSRKSSVNIEGTRIENGSYVVDAKCSAVDILQKHMAFSKVRGLI